MNFRNKKGLSIIEITIAFGVLMLAFVSISRAFPFGLSVNKSAEVATVASYLAQEKIEELTSSGYDNIAIGMTEQKQRISADPENYLYLFQRKTEVSYVDSILNPSDIDLGMKKIVTSVYYSDAISKQEKIFSISTLVSKK